MKRVLLLGGYGGFGSRIATRLAAAGWEVLVTGRSLDRAAEFCRARPGMRPVASERAHLPALLAQERPFAVVDAAGPFQGADYAVARAAITAGCHYLDIADGRDFVIGIGALDEAARLRGVTVLSGASSVPALSGAAVRALSAGLDEVRAVEMAISASSRAAAGRSVTHAILSYAGKPIRLWRGGRWDEGMGWGELRRLDLSVRGLEPIRRRVTALADVPDLELLPSRLPGCPAVIFRAGTESALQTLGLSLLARLVRIGWLRSLDPLAPMLLRAQRMTARTGSGRSGMVVRLFGTRAGARVERRWTLIAERGDGPEIPALAVPLLLDRLARGELAPGARDAGEALRLDEFETSFASLALRHEAVEIEQPPPLYARVMGEAFAALPPAVRRLHEVLRDDGATGRAKVTRGRHPLARLTATIIGFPPEGEHRLHVHFEEREGVERWTRRFGRHRFHSHLSESNGLAVERFGAMRFGFRLEGSAGGLEMKMRRWWLGPVPLPLAIAPRADAREWDEAGRFCFEVRLALPLIGPLVHYRGWLSPLRRSG